MIDPQLFVGLATVAIGCAIVGGVLVALLANRGLSPDEVQELIEQARCEAQAEFARRGQRASTNAKKLKREQQRQLVRDTAAQMRLDMAEKAKG